MSDERRQAPGATNVPTLSFEELTELRLYLRSLIQGAPDSLRPFYVPETGAFQRAVVPGEAPDKASPASTATCVSLLRAIGRLDQDEAPWKPEDWNRGIVTLVEAAEHGQDDVFVLAFTLEAIADLSDPAGVRNLTAEQIAAVTATATLLAAQLQDGRASISNYRPHIFLTFKAVSALQRWKALVPLPVETEMAVRDEAERRLHRHALLVAARDADADVFEVIYSVLVISALTPLSRMSPQQRSLLRFAVDLFFGAQRDGLWPRSHPLFPHEGGYAYCDDHELLASLLLDKQLRSLVQPWMPGLAMAARALDDHKYPLASDGDGDAPYGWSSGHQSEDPKAESWATAAALLFGYALDRLVAESIRTEVFAYVGVPYRPPRDKPGDKPYVPEGPDFLDAPLQLGSSEEGSLRTALIEGLIEPLVAARDLVANGHALPKRLPTSAILYGPPGTSKTTVAKYVARALGWPLLEIDPSHLTRQGLDNVHAEASRLFGMLARCEEVVVLLDEFDELVRERDGTGEIQSRFLTTAMLPKLIALGKERKIVYLLATNHLEQFDLAIRRPGRFRIVAAVLPPTVSEKRAHMPNIAQAMDNIAKQAGCWAPPYGTVADGPEGQEPASAEQCLGDLIYLEAEDLAKRLEDITEASEQARLLHGAWEAGVMAAPFIPNEPKKGTWRQAIVALHNRDRGLS